MRVIAWIVFGLIIGALGRLAVPGPNPMSIPVTILVGLGGSIIGGIVGALLLGRGGIFLSVVASAGIVYVMQRNSHGKATPRP